MKRRALFLAGLLALLVGMGARTWSAPLGSSRDEAEIRELFATYLRLHAAKQMEAWQVLFLPEAIAVRTGSDGVVRVYPIAELARGIAADAQKLASQHETFDNVSLDVHGHVGVYGTRYALFHNEQKVQQGRAFFSLVKKDGRWRIAGLVWYRE